MASKQELPTKPAEHEAISTSPKNIRKRKRSGENNYDQPTKKIKHNEANEQRKIFGAVNKGTN